MRRQRLTSRVLGDQRGITLIELLTVATLTVVVIGGMGAVVVSALNQQPRIADRAHDIAAGRQMVERMTRELREGSVVSGQTSSQISFRTYVRNSPCGSTTQLAADQPAIECQVRYACASGTCTRQEYEVGGTPGTAIEMVTGLHSDAVFVYDPVTGDPEHVSVTLVYPSEEGDEGVTVSDGVDLRNTS